MANIDFQKIQQQFQGLDPQNIGRWPPAPKWILIVLLFAAVLIAGWWFHLDGKLEELKMAEQEEEKLKTEHKSKLFQAINLEAFKKQKEEVSGYVLEMERALPSKAEMDQLLSDINYAGIQRGLQFELFRPGNAIAKEHYAELPISIVVTGSYHKIAGFAADLAALKRIVTLNNMSVSLPQTTTAALAGTLKLEATAKTFRYLDEEERGAQKKAKEGAKK